MVNKLRRKADQIDLDCLEKPSFETDVALDLKSRQRKGPRSGVEAISKTIETTQKRWGLGTSMLRSEEAAACFAHCNEPFSGEHLAAAQSLLRHALDSRTRVSVDLLRLPHLPPREWARSLFLRQPELLGALEHPYHVWLALVWCGLGEDDADWHRCCEAAGVTPESLSLWVGGARRMKSVRTAPNS